MTMKNLLIVFYFLIFCAVYSQGDFKDKIEISENIILATQNNKFELIDFKNNVILPFDYQAIEFDGSRGMAKKMDYLG